MWIGHGQCIEQYGVGEAYLPLLEALGRLCRGPEGERLVALLAQYAPSWVVQLPALLAAFLGLGLNYAAYESEIYRGALEAVPEIGRASCRERV